MSGIKKIYIKDIPELLQDESVWKHSFLSVSKHRIYAHYKNPTANPDDIVLLLAYADNEIVGYMGVFTDEIVLDGKPEKIGWLSTWWVHPKTKGSGIGRDILNTMYEANNGKIGISQFTPSAKRVYDKSGYFYTLKENAGIKAVLKSDLFFLLPQLYPSVKWLKPVFKFVDSIANLFISVKLYFVGSMIKSKLENVTIEYLNTLDPETEELVKRKSHSHISKKDSRFFTWLKAYNWVQDAPLLELTNKEKYEFSIYDSSFSIYLLKVIEKGKCVGFIVLQKRDKTMKVLFAYYEAAAAETVANIIKLQCIRQKVREVICYDAEINKSLKRSAVFIYTKARVKNSIISKVYGKENFEDVYMNFGDGDCSFA